MKPIQLAVMEELGDWMVDVQPLLMVMMMMVITIIVSDRMSVAVWGILCLISIVLRVGMIKG